MESKGAFFLFSSSSLHLLLLFLFIVVALFILFLLIAFACIPLCLSLNTMQLWLALFSHNLAAVGRIEHASSHMKSINQSYLPLFHRFLQPAAAAKHLSPDARIEDNETRLIIVDPWLMRIQHPEQQHQLRK